MVRDLVAISQIAPLLVAGVFDADLTVELGLADLPLELAHLPLELLGETGLEVTVDEGASLVDNHPARAAGSTDARRGPRHGGQLYRAMRSCRTSSPPRGGMAATLRSRLLEILPDAVDGAGGA